MSREVITERTARRPRRRGLSLDDRLFLAWQGVWWLLGVVAWVTRFHLFRH